MAQVAQDTFVAEVDGHPQFVQKGQVYPDGHRLVKLDAGRGLLFRPMDLGEDEPPAKRPRSRKAAPAAAGAVRDSEGGVS